MKKIIHILCSYIGKGFLVNSLINIYNNDDGKKEDLSSCRYDLTISMKNFNEALVQSLEESLIGRELHETIGNLPYLLSLQKDIIGTILEINEKNKEKKEEKIRELQREFRIASEKGYDYISNFSEGYAVVRKYGFYGLINEKGDEVFPLKYTYLGNVKGGNLLFSEDEEMSYDFKKCGIMTVKGEILCKPELSFYSEIFDSGFAKVYSEWGFRLVDNKGKFVTQEGIGYNDIKWLGGDLYSIHIDSQKKRLFFGEKYTSKRCGLIKGNGDTIVSPDKYGDIRDYEVKDGISVAIVSEQKNRSNDELKGLINVETGEEIISPEYKYLDSVKNSKYYEVTGKTEGYVDIYGNRYFKKDEIDRVKEEIGKLNGGNLV